MTSTNDGKDVRNIQTSGQKGKSYYIELYKSLEARLSSECDLAARTHHLCEAWRLVYSLCQKSSSLTHPHLLGWLQRHTAKIVLQSEWQSPKSKNERSSLEDAINAYIQECEAAVATRGGEKQPWESQLLQRAEWFKSVLSNPWGHPVLKTLLDPRGEAPHDDQIIEWLKEERGLMFVTRLLHLSASKCDDLALSLASAVMDRVRASIILVPDAAQTEEEEPQNTKSLFAKVLHLEAGFTADVWDTLTDIEFVLLHKYDGDTRCIQLAKQTPLRMGCALVERLRTRLENSPKEKRLWKNAKEVATLIAQVVVARCMVVPVCGDLCRKALLQSARSLARLLGPRLPPAARSLAAPAASARHLHTLATAVDKECSEDMRPFVCELYVRAITAGMNELERLKLHADKAGDARLMEQTLAEWFLQLGRLLAGSARLLCECALTAFSVHPSPPMFQQIRDAPHLPPTLQTDVQETKEATTSEFGSWACDSRSQTNFVKTSETLNLKQSPQQANVLSTAILSEGEALGLSAELCQDLAVLLSGPRVKTLSWDMKREDLLENGRAYMERTHCGTKALTTELKYLNLDPKNFLHLPEEDDNENDLYYGIEKGYEHLVVPLEPEEIWEDTFWRDDDQKTESPNSCQSEVEIEIKPRRKKKSKTRLSSDDDCDPLSLVAEEKKKSEKKERPHSKERSKKSSLDREATKERRKDRSHSKEKLNKKSRKKREKKTKDDSLELKSGSLSSLLGMKVTIPNTNEDSNKLHKVCEPPKISSVTDSDYDSQGKFSLNSEGHDPNVIFDGLFCMDDIKSPERTTIGEKGSSTNNYKEFNSATNIKSTLPLNDRCRISENKTDHRQPPNILKRSESNMELKRNSTQASSLGVTKNSNPVDKDTKKSIVKLLQFRKKKSEGSSLANSQKTVGISQGENQSRPVLQNVSETDTSRSPKNPLIGTRVLKPEPSPYFSIKNPEASTSGEKNNPNFNKCLSNVNKTKLIINRGLIQQNKDKQNVQSVNNTNSIHNLLNQKVTTAPVGNLKLYRNVPKNKQAKETTMTHLKSFENFLKDLQETLNAGTDKILPEHQNIIKKELSKQTNALHLHSSKADMKIPPQCAKQLPTNIPEKAPPTFSRLSYMHRNKQSETKPKLSANSVIVRNKGMSQSDNNTFDDLISDLRQSKLNMLQKDKEVNVQSIRINDNSSLTKNHSILSNILHNTAISTTKILMNPKDKEFKGDEPTKSSACPTKKSLLSNKDQQDLLSILRQKYKMNSPTIRDNEHLNKVNVVHSQNSILTPNIANETSAYQKEYSAPLQLTTHNQEKSNLPLKTNCTSASIATTNSRTITKNIVQNKTKPAVKTAPQEYDIGLKPDVGISDLDSKMLRQPTVKEGSTTQKDDSKQDWAIVMDALLSHKTPSRGSSSSSREIISAQHLYHKQSRETGLRNHRIVRTNPKDIVKNDLTKIQPMKAKPTVEAPKIVCDANLITRPEQNEKSVLTNPLVIPTNCLVMPNSTEVVPSNKQLTVKHTQVIKPVTNVSKQKNKSTKPAQETLKCNTNNKPFHNPKVALDSQKINLEQIVTTKRDQAIIKSLKNRDVSVIVNPTQVKRNHDITNKSCSSLETVGQHIVIKPQVKKCIANCVELHKNEENKFLKRYPNPKSKCQRVNQMETKKLLPEANNKSLPLKLKDNDPFISGLQNSEYDLIEELMDDDLRQEIGELSSDEELYSTPTTIPRFKDSIKCSQTNICTKSINSSTEKPITGKKFLRNPKDVNLSSEKINTEHKGQSINLSNEIQKNDQKCLRIPQGITVSSEKLNTEKKILRNTQDYTLKTDRIVDATICQNNNSANENKLAATNVCGNTIYQMPQSYGTPKVNSSYNDDGNTSGQMNINPTQVYIAPQPTALQNVVLIGSEIVYETYPTIHIQETQINANLSDVHNTFVTVSNLPNIALYQTTQFAAPVINPLIIGNATTVPSKHVQSVINTTYKNLSHTVTNSLSNTDSSTINGDSSPERSGSIKNDSSTKKDSSNLIIDSKNNNNYSQFCHNNNMEVQNDISSIKTFDFERDPKCNSDSQNIKMSNNNITTQRIAKPDINNFNEDEGNKLGVDFNMNKNNERKVLSEVQEKLQAPEKTDKLTVNCRQSTEIEFKKERLKEQERLKKKRLSLINRQISYRIYYPPIPLSYTPLSKTNQLNNKTGEEDIPIITTINKLKKIQEQIENSRVLDVDYKEFNIPEVLECRDDVENKDMKSYKSKENKNDGDRKIFLRSSNNLNSKAVSPTIDKINSIGIKTKVRLKRAFKNTTDQNDTNTEISKPSKGRKKTKKISVKRTSKRLSNREAKKLNHDESLGNHLPDKNTNISKNDNFLCNNSNRGEENNGYIDAIDYIDIESKLTGTKILKRTPTLDCTQQEPEHVSDDFASSGWNTDFEDNIINENLHNKETADVKYDVSMKDLMASNDKILDNLKHSKINKLDTINNHVPGQDTPNTSGYQNMHQNQKSSNESEITNVNVKYDVSMKGLMASNDKILDDLKHNETNKLDAISNHVSNQDTQNMSGYRDIHQNQKTSNESEITNENVKYDVSVRGLMACNDKILDNVKQSKTNKLDAISNHVSCQEDTQIISGYRDIHQNQKSSNETGITNEIVKYDISVKGLMASNDKIIDNVKHSNKTNKFDAISNHVPGQDTQNTLGYQDMHQKQKLSNESEIKNLNFNDVSMKGLMASNDKIFDNLKNRKTNKLDAISNNVSDQDTQNISGYRDIHQNQKSSNKSGITNENVKYDVSVKGLMASNEKILDNVKHSKTNKLDAISSHVPDQVTQNTSENQGSHRNQKSSNESEITDVNNCNNLASNDKKEVANSEKVITNNLIVLKDNTKNVEKETFNNNSRKSVGDNSHNKDTLNVISKDVINETPNIKFNSELEVKRIQKNKKEPCEDITITEIPNQSNANPNEKILRVKVGNSKNVYKVTIADKLNMFTSKELLEHPSFKSFLTRNLNGHSKHSLNIAHSSTADEKKIKAIEFQEVKKTVESVAAPVCDIVDLLSDEEESSNTDLETNFEKYIRTKLDPLEFEKHREKLMSICRVNLRKIDDPDTTASKNKDVTDRNSVIVIDEKVNFNNVNPIETDYTTDVDQICSQNVHSVNENNNVELMQEPLDIIEINDSTDEDENVKSDNKIEEFKNLLLLDLGIEPTGIKDSTNTENVDIVKDDVENKNCILKIEKCDSLAKLYDKIKQNQCYVKLENCDILLTNSMNKLETSDGLSTEPPSPTGSYSILQDFTFEEHDDSASPLLNIEASLTDLHVIHQKSNESESCLTPSTKSNNIGFIGLFECEYFITKRLLSRLSKIISNYENFTENTKCASNPLKSDNKDFCKTNNLNNPLKKNLSSDIPAIRQVVPTLFNIVVNYFNKNQFTFHLKCAHNRETSNLCKTTNKLKRKLTLQSFNVNKALKKKSNSIMIQERLLGQEQRPDRHKDGKYSDIRDVSDQCDKEINTLPFGQEGSDNPNDDESLCVRDNNDQCDKERDILMRNNILRTNHEETKNCDISKNIIDLNMSPDETFLNVLKENQVLDVVNGLQTSDFCISDNSTIINDGNTSSNFVRNLSTSSKNYTNSKLIMDIDVKESDFTSTLVPKNNIVELEDTFVEHSLLHKEIVSIKVADDSAIENIRNFKHSIENVEQTRKSNINVAIKNIVCNNEREIEAEDHESKINVIFNDDSVQSSKTTKKSLRKNQNELSSESHVNLTNNANKAISTQLIVEDTDYESNLTEYFIQKNCVESAKCQTLLQKSNLEIIKTQIFDNAELNIEMDALNAERRNESPVNVNCNNFEICETPRTIDKDNKSNEPGDFIQQNFVQPLRNEVNTSFQSHNNNNPENVQIEFFDDFVSKTIENAADSLVITEFRNESSIDVTSDTFKMVNTQTIIENKDNKTNITEKVTQQNFVELIKDIVYDERNEYSKLKNIVNDDIKYNDDKELGEDSDKNLIEPIKSNIEVLLQKQKNISESVFIEIKDAQSLAISELRNDSHITITNDDIKANNGEHVKKDGDNISTVNELSDHENSTEDILRPEGIDTTESIAMEIYKDSYLNDVSHVCEKNNDIISTEHTMQVEDNLSIVNENSSFQNIVKRIKSKEDTLLQKETGKVLLKNNLHLKMQATEHDTNFFVQAHTGLTLDDIKSNFDSQEVTVDRYNDPVITKISEPSLVCYEQSAFPQLCVINNHENFMNNETFISQTKYESDDPLTSEKDYMGKEIEISSIENELTNSSQVINLAHGNNYLQSGSDKHTISEKRSNCLVEKNSSAFNHFKVEPIVNNLDISDIQHPKESLNDTSTVTIQVNNSLKELSGSTSTKVVLKGVEYKDPIIGKCYVFPLIIDTKDNSGNSLRVVKTLNDSRVSKGDLKEEQDLKLMIPRTTYSRVHLKRKLDMKDIKMKVKKYRKSKNIDYPKFTLASMKRTGYRDEYRCLINYHRSVKFSYSRPFNKEPIYVHDLMKDWPIKGICTGEVQNENDIDKNLFGDLENVQINDPKEQTFSEEINATYEEIDNFSDEVNEVNFNTGFGEGSGRVIQNLGSGCDIVKFSAATLSDVKQTQPFLSFCRYNGKNKYLKLEEIYKEQMQIIQRHFTYMEIRNNVRLFFQKTNLLSNLSENFYSKPYIVSLLSGLYRTEHMKPSTTSPIVQVVQVGQLPVAVSAAAQNPVTCDPRVTHVSDASPPQCSAENSPSGESQSVNKTQYTELTTADITLPLVQEYVQQNQINVGPQETNMLMTDRSISIDLEIKSDDANIKEDSEVKSKNTNSHETIEMGSVTSNIEFPYDTTTSNSNAPMGPEPNIEIINSTEMLNPTVQERGQNSKTFSREKDQSAEKIDQIAHAMNAAGISTIDADESARVHTLVNVLTQKLQQNTTNNTHSKTTPINAMALQQALAQILPPPLNQTSSSENIPSAPNTGLTSQVLHIVQGKNTTGNQITLVDNSQQSVINNPNTTQLLHIVQNKSATSSAATNGASASQPGHFSGLSLVDAGIQQGGNQLLHIVNTGQKNNNTGQIIKRVNLVTNLQGSSEQKVVQFVCKSADGKAIHLNAPHQRSMVLRLQPIDSSNVQTVTTQKPIELQDLNSTPNNTNTVTLKENTTTQHEIKSRSVYEENYAKFIQNSSPKPVVEKSTSLPKFNQAFGKPVFQDDNQKQNEVNTDNTNLQSMNTNTHLQSVNTNEENNHCPPAENTLNLEHMEQMSSPPLLLRKTITPTSQSQPNLVQQIKQTIAPMNIQTMHGGVIYTRQIPVNIGGGQTINLITVPSTELVDESGQKHQADVKFVNQNEIEPSIIKIVPQTQSHVNNDVSTDESNAHLSVNNENSKQTQPQSQQQPQPQVLTQMRIKLPMLSKAPQMVPGARVVRPSFLQIQRNVIGGSNQPVYQQLVLTTAPPLGQQTIRLPQTQTQPPNPTPQTQTQAQTQANRQIKVSTDSQSGQSSTESQMSSSTLEQLREFDMVLEQVKERSTVQPSTMSCNSFTKMRTTSSDTTDSTASPTSSSTESTQQVLYSIGNNPPINVAYVNRKPSISTPTTSTFVRSPDSSGIVDSPNSSSHIPHTITSESSSNDQSSQQKSSKSSSKSKSRPKSSSQPNSLKINNVPPKTSTQKPLEDEQTTQRILYILAEYKEQVENSPDKDKPAPRRRNNLPTNPGGTTNTSTGTNSNGTSKRKKSSSSSRRSGRDVSPMDDGCRTMGSEDSSCGTSQGDCTESCLESHSPQDSPRKVVRKLTFEQETPVTQPRPLPHRNVIVADGQTITVARGASGKPTTAVLMPANYILPVSMVKSGQQIAIVTNRGPKLITVGGGEGGTTNALLLQRLIGPGLKPVLARPGVRHVRLPAAALQNLQAFNLTTATTVNPPDSTPPSASAPTPPDLVDTRATSSPWPDRGSQETKLDRSSSPEGSEPWNLVTSADPHDYSYEETVRTDNMDRTVLDPIPDRYSPDMEAQRIFDKMFDVDSKRSYIVDSNDDSPRCGYDIDASDCDDKAYHQVVQRKEGVSHRQHRLTHVSAAALRHKYAILEHELRLQKSLSEECEDLGVDSPSASELFPEADLLFAASPAHEQTQEQGPHSHTPQPTSLNQSSIPQPDIDDQIATDQLLSRDHMDRQELGLGLEDVGIVTVSEDGMRATIALDQEEFARSHPNTTFHSEPTDDGVVQPFTISNMKGRQVTSIYQSNGGPATVLMTAQQPSVISQAAESSGVGNAIKYADIDNMIDTLPSVLIKDDGLTRFDEILDDTRELHLSNAASAIVHSTGATQVIRRVCYEDKREARFLMEDPVHLIAGDDARDEIEDDRSSPERHGELFWESNSASERSESRRPMDFSSDSDKCCKSPYDETNSTDSSGIGAHMRLDSVIKEARGGGRAARRGGERSASDGSSDEMHPPLRTYPAKRSYGECEASEAERSVSGKTRAGEQSPELRRRASNRGVVKRGCHCCNGDPEPNPPRPKKPRQRKPTLDFNA